MKMTDIVIIGGGVAGLSAGIYARLNGYSAQVYEMDAKAGGNLCSWEREGCVMNRSSDAREKLRHCASVMNSWI